jgi:hypothetical protein
MITALELPSDLYEDKSAALNEALLYYLYIPVFVIHYNLVSFLRTDFMTKFLPCIPRSKQTTEDEMRAY